MVPDWWGAVKEARKKRVRITMRRTLEILGGSCYYLYLELIFFPWISVSNVL